MEAALLARDARQRRVAGQAPGENWRAAAACQDTDPDLFFPVSESGKSLEQVAQAKAICRACPVRRPCLAFALRTRQADGIWGGLTEEERREPKPPGGDWARRPAAVAGIGMASRNMTAAALQALSDRVQEASRMPSRPGWERKAAAFAETFRMLAEATGDGATGSPTGVLRELMTAVGPAANGMIISAHRRLLAHLRAGDADGAARELAGHLAALHYMWRLAGAERTTGAAAAAG